MTSPGTSPKKTLNGSFGSHFNPPSSYMTQYENNSDSNNPNNITPNSSSRHAEGMMDNEISTSIEPVSKKRRKRSRDNKKHLSSEVMTDGASSNVSNLITMAHHKQRNEEAPVLSIQRVHSQATQIRYSLPTQDYLSETPVEEQAVRKKKTMKKSKRHRKRHILPGPASALQLTSDPSLLNKSTSLNKVDSCLKQSEHCLSQKYEHDSQSYSQVQQTPFSSTSSMESIPTIVGTIIHIQDDPAWKSMCVSLSRYTPHFSQIYQHNHSIFRSNHTTTQILSTYLQKSLSLEYGTLFEVLSGKHDCTIHSNLVVYISNIYRHSHCDYTCELMDESGLRINGWLHERFVKEHEQEGVVRIGTVLLLKETSITIYRKEDTVMEGGVSGIAGGMENDGSQINNEHNDHEVTTDTSENQSSSSDVASSNSNSTNSLERMLLIGEDTVVCWWKASDAVNVTYQEEKHLFQERNKVGDRLIREKLYQLNSHEDTEKRNSSPINSNTDFPNTSQQGVSKRKNAKNKNEVETGLNDELNLNNGNKLPTESPTSMVTDLPKTDYSGLKDHESSVNANNIISIEDSNQSSMLTKTQNCLVRQCMSSNDPFRTKNLTKHKALVLPKKSQNRSVPPSTSLPERETVNATTYPCDNKHAESSIPGNSSFFHNNQKKSPHNPYKKKPTSIDKQKTKLSGNTLLSKAKNHSRVPLKPSFEKGPTHGNPTDMGTLLHQEKSHVQDKTIRNNVVNPYKKNHKSSLQIKEPFAKAKCIPKTDKSLNVGDNSIVEKRISLQESQQLSTDAAIEKQQELPRFSVANENVTNLHKAIEKDNAKAERETKGNEKHSIWTSFGYDIDHDLLEEDHSPSLPQEPKIPMRNKIDQTNLTLITQHRGQGSNIFENPSAFAEIDFGEDDFEDR